MKLELTEFEELFNLLLSAYGKPPNSKLTEVYYELMANTDPSPDEAWNAIAQFIDSPTDRFPSGQELKQVIWDDRRKKQPVLPDIKPVKPNTEEAFKFRLTVLRVVYAEQGDSRFYRALLEGRSALSVCIPASKVTHNDVLTAL